MHTIRHDNYETWLMLYLDNELTAPERAAVEAFAKANPAVQEELDGLKEAMLQPEQPVAMPGKERLFMPEAWNEEALTLQQEQLLLLADNELPAMEKASLEAVINKDPLLQKEWKLLQQTKATTGIPLEMPGKNSLYRHERTRVIPFGRVLKFAAAAAILAFGWFLVNGPKMSSTGGAGNGEVAQTGSNKLVTEPVVTKTDTLLKSGEDQQAPLKEAGAVFAVEQNSKKTPGAAPGATIARYNKAENKPNIPGNVTEANDKPMEVFALAGNREPVDKLVATEVIEVGSVTENEISPVVHTAHVELDLPVQKEKNPGQTEIVDSEDLTDDGTISIGGARIPKQKIRNVYRSLTRPITRSLERSGPQVAYAK